MTAKSNEKEPRTAKPGTLLSQWWTLGALLADGRTTGRHAKVAWVIIDRFMQKHGTGRASLRYIEKATGMSRNTVIKACRELADWGHVEQTLGTGTRPTEYIPRWLVVHPSAPLASGEPICTTGGEPLCTTTAASGAPICAESYLSEPADRPASQVSSTVSAAPPADGLAATAAASGFERVWKAYGKHGNKLSSREVFAAIDNPDVDHIAERAAAWAASAKPGQRRMPLEKWLAAEKYDEADRKVPAKQPASAIGTAKADNDNDPLPIPLWARGKPQNWPDGSYPIKIVEADTHEDEYSDEKAIILKYRIVDGEHAGEEHEHVFWTVSSFSPENATKGTEHLNAIMKAVNQETLQEAAELLDRFLRATVAGDSIEYSALSDKEFDAAADMDALTDPERIAA